ncbi:MAG: hypothetical protein ACPGED_09930, partial [Flavobacteriales bacterium]
MNFKKLHYFSGITISVFIGIHLVNHGLSLLGAQAHIDFMNEIRVVYRNTIVESILLLAVLIQIISGIKLFFTKRKSSTSFFDTLQVWTGLYLAFFFVVHIGAILFGRLILHLDTNFYFGIAGLNTYPLNLFFIP